MTCECSELPRTKGWFRQYLLMSKIFGWIEIGDKWRHLVGSWLSFTGKVKLRFALPVYSSPHLSWKHLPQKTGRKKIWMRSKCQMALQSVAVRLRLSDTVICCAKWNDRNPWRSLSFEHELAGFPALSPGISLAQRCVSERNSRQNPKEQLPPVFNSIRSGRQNFLPQKKWAKPNNLFIEGK